MGNSVCKGKEQVKCAAGPGQEEGKRGKEKAGMTLVTRAANASRAPALCFLRSRSHNNTTSVCRVLRLGQVLGSSLCSSEQP